MPQEKKPKTEKVQLQKQTVTVSYKLTITLPEGAKKFPSTERIARGVKHDIREFGLGDIVGGMVASDVLIDNTI